MEKNDTPRGLKIDLNGNLKLVVAPDSTTNGNTIDLYIPNGSNNVTWFGEAGGELWGYWNMFKASNETAASASQISNHIILTLDFENDVRMRDVVYIVATVKMKNSASDFYYKAIVCDNSSPPSAATSAGTTAESNNQTMSPSVSPASKQTELKHQQQYNKLKNKNKSLSTQLEVIEDQLEQLSEAFDEVVNSKSEIEETHSKEIKRLTEERESLEAKLRESTNNVERLESELQSKPSQLYHTKTQQHQPSQQQLNSDDQKEAAENASVEKWKLEASSWKRKCDAMSNDIKRLLKTQVDSDKRDKIQQELNDTTHELESYKMALAHALSQVEEMRMREHALLGNTFERTNLKPRNKSYTNVGRNIVKMRKRVKTLKIDTEKIQNSKARKKIGKTWGKVKRGVGIKKSPRASASTNDAMMTERRESFFDDDEDDGVSVEGEEWAEEGKQEVQEAPPSEDENEVVLDV